MKTGNYLLIINWSTLWSQPQVQREREREVCVREVCVRSSRHSRRSPRVQRETDRASPERVNTLELVLDVLDERERHLLTSERAKTLVFRESVTSERT